VVEFSKKVFGAVFSEWSAYDLLWSLVPICVCLLFLWNRDRSGFWGEVVMYWAIGLAVLFLLLSRVVWVSLHLIPEIDPGRRYFLAITTLAMSAAAGGFVWFYRKQPIEMSAPAELTGSPVVGKTFRFTDLVLTDGTGPRNVVFEQCVILGPAVLCAGGQEGMTIAKCTFEGRGTYDHQFLGAVAYPPSGAIRALGCSFLRCKFSGVSFVAPANDIDAFKESMRANNSIGKY